MGYQTLLKKKVDASFNLFVDNYIEFCNSKIFKHEEGETETNEDKLNTFVKKPNLVVLPLENTADKKNCLDELNNVGDIIDKLFDSEKNFIKEMNKDIDNFNQLYNCSQFCDLVNKGGNAKDVAEAKAAEAKAAEAKAAEAKAAEADAKPPAGNNTKTRPPAGKTRGQAGKTRGQAGKPLAGRNNTRKKITP